MSILTPVKAIRKYCKWCMGGQSFEIKNCDIRDCALYLFHLGTEPKGSSPLKSIRAKCKDCSYDSENGGWKPVNECANDFTDGECPLWVYRFGKRPAKQTQIKNPFKSVECLATNDFNESESQKGSISN